MISSSKRVRLIMITADQAVAELASRAGIDEVMIDLERRGKQQRQRGLDTWISDHRLRDISTIAPLLAGTRTGLIVRTNPLHTKTTEEVEEAIARGATELMLPMFRHPDEIVSYLTIVNNRVKVTLLLETASALARLQPILELPYKFCLHIGLNDLHLEMKLDFMFELFTGGVIDHVASMCRASSRDFGIGGIARPNSVTARVPAELIAAQHSRLGSSGVILSRDWHETRDLASLSTDVEKLRSMFEVAPSASQLAEFNERIAHLTRQRH